MKPLDLMNLHVETLYVLNDAGQLLSVNEPPFSTPAPYLFAGTTKEGRVWRFHGRVSGKLRSRLKTVDFPLQPLTEQTDVRTIIAIRKNLESRGFRVGTVWNGPAYYLSSQPPPESASTVSVDQRNSLLLAKHFPHLIAELTYNWPCIAVVHDGHAVSVCRTVRRSSDGAEAGVRTAESYRCRGYASKAVSRWALELWHSGVVPLYSTSWDNIASQRLAASIGFVRFGVDLHFSR